MAITKRMRVSFDLKAVFSEEDLKSYTNELVALSKAFTNGDKLSGWDLQLIKSAAEGGVEEAIELHFKKVIAKKLKDVMPEQGVTLSNVTTRFKQ